LHLGVLLFGDDGVFEKTTGGANFVPIGEFFGTHFNYGVIYVFDGVGLFGYLLKCGKKRGVASGVIRDFQMGDFGKAISD